MKPEPPLTVAEAAELWGVSPRRVRRLIEEGRVAARKVGRDHLILQSEPPEPQKRGRKPKTGPGPT